MGNGPSKSPANDSSVETFSLIWLDATVNTSPENIKSQEILRESINQLTTFNTSDECMKEIQNRSANDRIILISSGGFGETLVPQIHELRQIFSIYIYCWNKEYHERWSKKFVKVNREFLLEISSSSNLFQVQGVFTVLKELIDRILFDQNFQKYKVGEQVSISIFHTKHFETQCEMDSYEHFIYSHLLVNSLLQLPMTEVGKKELSRLCRLEYQNNRNELQMINDFEKTYSGRQAISWFTRNSFLYKMIIKALRIQNLDILFLFRFVIQDIQTQIKHDHISASLDVYRSQLMTKNELQKLKDSWKQFISVNSFLSGITDRTTAIDILNKSSISYEIERVLFEIRADGRLPGVKPFTSIKSKTNHDQDEILFSIGSIFQLDEIRLGEGNIWIVQMTLCSNNNNQLQPMFQDIEKRYGDIKSTFNSFGLILQEMLKYDEAEKFYRRLLMIQSSNPQLAEEHKQTMNQIRHDKVNYDQRLFSLDASIERTIKKTKINNYSLASGYMQNGEKYRKQGHLKEALQWYEKAFNLLTQSYGEDHQEVGRCHNKIGLIYEDEGSYAKALERYEQAKNILEEHLSSDHPDLSDIFSRIGDMHQHLSRYDEALKNYEKALEIAQRAAISQLPSIISIMNKIASIYETGKDFRSALTYYENLAELLPSKHVHVEENTSNIDRIRRQLS